MQTPLFTHRDLNLPWDVKTFTQSRSDIAQRLTVDMVEFLNNNNPTKTNNVGCRHAWDKFSRQAPILLTFKSVEVGIAQRLFETVFQHWVGLTQVTNAG